MNMRQKSALSTCVALSLLLSACIPAAIPGAAPAGGQTTYPAADPYSPPIFTEQTAYPAGDPALPTTPPTPDLSAYYGDPPPAMLTVGDQEQEAAVGTYTWIEKQAGEQLTQVHADTFASITPDDPLPVRSPFNAFLQLPVPVPPASLRYDLAQAKEELVWNHHPDHGTISWTGLETKGSELNLQAQQELTFNLPPGRYVLDVQAGWHGLGSANYGFYLEVLGEGESGADPAAAPFPWPTPEPVEAFSPPGEPEMIYRKAEGSPWETWSPKDWQAGLEQGEEVPYISSILEAPDGTYWFASMGGATSTGTGVYRFDGETWTHFTTESGLPANEITSMVAAPDGAVWFGTLCCGAARYDGRTWTTFTSAHGLASEDIRSLAAAPDGALWFGSGEHGASRFFEGQWKTFNAQNGLHSNFVGGIFTIPEGYLLFSTSGGRTAGLDRFDGQVWTPYPTEWTAQGRYTRDVLQSWDAELWSRGLWFATEFDGVYRLFDNGWTHFTQQDGLLSDTVSGIAVSTDGPVWIGTDQGLSSFDGENWIVYGVDDGLASNPVTALYAAWHGTFWVGTAGGILHYVTQDEPAFQPASVKNLPGN